jgi:hypothetical protein
MARPLRTIRLIQAKAGALKLKQSPFAATALFLSGKLAAHRNIVAPERA